MSNATIPNKNRLGWIDCTKGLAILGIVLFHFFQNYPDRIPLVSLLDKIGAKVGFAAVDIFFVMAGFTTSYILALKARKKNQDKIEPNWKSWLIKRMNRIYPTYILAVLCSLFLLQFFGTLKNRPTFEYFLSFLGLAGYTFQAINPGFWFFTVLLEAYLAIPIVFYLAKNKPQNILYIGIAGGVLTKLACLMVDKKSELYWYLLQNDFLGSYFFPLCLGLYWGLVYWKHDSLRKKDYAIASAVFGGGLVLYALAIALNIQFEYMQGFDILFTPFFFIVCYWIFTTLSGARSPISYGMMGLSLMGIYSYQIYLIHQPLFFVLLSPLTKVLTFNPYLEIVLVLLITIALLTLYVFFFTSLEMFLRKLMAKVATQQT